MAKKSVIERNLKRAACIEKFKEKRSSLKKKLADRNLPLDQRISLVFQLHALPRDSSAVRYMNRCVLTGRASAVYRKFRLSRIMFRTLALEGKIPGVIKASW